MLADDALARGPAAGRWAVQQAWEVTAVADAVRVRAAISEMVAATTAAPDGLFFAAAGARAETAAGELLLNAVHHGAAPVRATLSRGEAAWLIEVTDAAADHRPTVPAVPTGPEGNLTTPGGLGLRLALRVSDSVGWYPTEGGKTVWARVGDRAPARLTELLTHQNG